MYVRETRFYIDPSRMSEARQQTVPFISVLTRQDGCQSAVFYAPNDREIVVVSVWDSEAHARGADSVRDRAQAELGDLWVQAPTTVVTPAIE